MIRRISVAVMGGALLAIGAAVAAPAADTWDGLVRVHSENRDEVYLLPGADLSGYKAVLLEPVGVAFRRNWLRDANATRGVPRIKAADMDELGAEMAALLHKSLASELAKAGWKLTDTPGEDVLRIKPMLRDLNVAAPDPAGTVGRRVYIMQAGESKLVLELADGATNQLVARSVDRRRAGDDEIVRWATDATNRDDFERMFERWSRSCVGDLGRMVRGEIKVPTR